MDKNKKLKVGMLGFGTVGSGVVELFSNTRDFIELKSVAVRDDKKPRKISFGSITTDAKQVLDDPEISIVIELIGGCHPAKEYIEAAIKNGKHVVTANKAVISEYGPELFELARQHNVNIGFEGAVAGGIPIINPLLEQLSHGKIEGITGILNGTTNFILTRMSEGMDYGTALKIAQEKGFAEAEPSFDVEGKDAAQKIAILASLAFGRWVYPNEVYTEGISRISPVDIEYARDLGYAVKLLAIAGKSAEGKIDVRVHPTLIERSHRLAGVDEEFNAIHIQGQPFDEYFNVGKGAGQGPTAFSVYFDIVKIAEMIKSGTLRKMEFKDTSSEIADQDEVIAEGYLRLYLRHVPGSLYNVVGVLYQNGWNVKDSLQRSGPNHGIIIDGVKCMPNIITHEPLKFGVIKKTLSDLMILRTEKGGPVYGDPFYMRVQRNQSY